MCQKKFTKTLSVIIPVYNSSEFIDRCLQSILNQSFKDFELIIIDDNSIDNSIYLIKKKLESIPNSYIIKTNGGNGAGGARNIGLKNARGKYISFIDSDDWIDSMMFEKMINVIEKHNAEIAICGVMTEYNNSRLADIRYKYELENVINGDFALELLSRQLTQDISISPVVWNKIYLNDFLRINDIKFIPNNYNEDDNFTFICFLNATKIVLTPNTYYHYFQNTKSSTHSFSKKHINDLIHSFSELKGYMTERKIFSSYEDQYYSFFEKCLSFILSNIIEHEKDFDIQIKYISLLCKQLSCIISENNYLKYVGLQRIYNFVKPYNIK